jgi:hypothetical protein
MVEEEESHRKDLFSSAVPRKIAMFQKNNDAKNYQLRRMGKREQSLNFSN